MSVPLVCVQTGLALHPQPVCATRIQHTEARSALFPCRKVLGVAAVFAKLLVSLSWASPTSVPPVWVFVTSFSAVYFSSSIFFLFSLIQMGTAFCRDFSRKICPSADIITVINGSSVLVQLMCNLKSKVSYIFASESYSDCKSIKNII